MRSQTARDDRQQLFRDVPTLLSWLVNNGVWQTLTAPDYLPCLCWQN
ncbi:hypothetical protein PVM13_25575 [Klebsiella variicola]|nr:hypothetical protein [Klebsiella variicola]MCJ5285005.1 hypothetical protein [Klebsiella variicola]MCJ5306873.1 hypothetical protein [Klebsiella variicola]MDD9252132.1 hypothetical protein [Klebsiella variicola]MDZ3704619.1 hypothetical protein [Klebsiella variicola]